MTEYLVSAQITNLYNITIEAENEQEARDKFDKMQSTQIREDGSLQTVETELIEIEEN